MFETTVRYNNNNNKHPVETQPEFYDSILFEPHLVAFNSDATKEKIYDITGSEGIDYYIDPGLAEFERGRNFRKENGDITDWTRAYLRHLGDPLSSILEERGNANPEKMTEQDISEIAASVVRFQETFATDAVNVDLSNFADIGSPPAEPKKIIPWYNKIDDESKISTAKTILNASQDAATIPLKPCVYTTKSMISDAGTRSNLIDLVDELDVSECFLIIEGLDKRETGQSVYENVIKFVYDIRDRGIVPHFLYGDFFSHLLAYFGLGGTTYGTLYAEEHTEELKATDGGNFPNRYYFDPIKDFVNPASAADLGLNTDFDLCDCPVCSRKFDSWQDMAEKVQEEEDEDDIDDDEPQSFEKVEDNSSVENLKTVLQKHYLAKRWDHTLTVQSESFDDLIAELKDDHQSTVTPFSQSFQINDDRDLDYMMRWVHAAKEMDQLAYDTLDDFRTGL
ncbi:uncharacterized protein HHUB_2197 [Halobacterium hubeiense]|uniref:tRNA-guanine transglycosylase n=1 Tax=Halobacterium hubeiense TaxID=1407499 RepID=A0A0U5H2P1_9EURY|nr:hypothetical protein [Halobacterium hubeiense]CQH55197.1 uncharacterized protein HHUB_2197 [Halobacterium hubeiense]